MRNLISGNSLSPGRENKNGSQHVYKNDLLSFNTTLVVEDENLIFEIRLFPSNKSISFYTIRLFYFAIKHRRSTRQSLLWSHGFIAGNGYRLSRADLRGVVKTEGGRDGILV